MEDESVRPGFYAQHAAKSLTEQAITGPQTPKRQYDFTDSDNESMPYSYGGLGPVGSRIGNSTVETPTPAPRKTIPSFTKSNDAQKHPTLSEARSSAVKHLRPGSLEMSQSAEVVEASSSYSDDNNQGLPQADPFNIPHRTAIVPTNASILQSYNEWKGPNLVPEHGTAVQDQNVGHSSRKQPPSQLNIKSEGHLLQEEPQYSPLTPFFVDKEYPGPKKGSKTLIGENGWLQRTNTGKTSNSSPQKKGGILDSIKKVAKELGASRRGRSTERAAMPRSRSASRPRTSTSLDPREQSLLYCELEFIVSTALDAYISSQLGEGRLVAERLARIAEAWAAKGRPRVSGFRYDVETQLDLVRAHLHEFRFHGRRQGQPVEIAGLLDAMRTNARTIRIRTFCWPDPVVAKQILDAQALLSTLGSPDRTQRALAEVAQFFKVIVEREKDRDAMKELHAARQEQPLPDLEGITFARQQQRTSDHNSAGSGSGSGSNNKKVKAFENRRGDDCLEWEQHMNRPPTSAEARMARVAAGYAPGGGQARSGEIGGYGKHQV